MRKKETKWVQRTFRLRDETVKIYKYLEFCATTKNIPKNILFDKIVMYSIDFIEKNTPRINFVESDIKREVKGFTISTDTLDLLKDFFKANSAINKGQVLEILIGIYAEQHIPKDELEPLGMYLNTDSEFN